MMVESALKRGPVDFVLSLDGDRRPVRDRWMARCDDAASRTRMIDYRRA